MQREHTEMETKENILLGWIPKTKANETSFDLKPD